MWAIAVAAVSLVVTLVFSLAKTSSRGEEITENHREELLNRKKEDK